MNQVTVGYTFEGITKMAQSYMVNGKFVCPQLPPSCFGLAVHYKMTEQDIEQLIKEYGMEEIINVVGVGDVIQCGTLVVRDKPYKKYQAVAKPVNTKKYDTANKAIKKSGKPGTIERLNALQAYYNSDESEISPFACDMAELVSKSAIGKAYEDYHSKDIDAEQVA